MTGVQTCALPISAAGGWFASPDLPTLLRAFAAVPLLGCLSAWREALLLRDGGRIGEYNLVLVLRDGSSLLIGLLGLWAGAGLVALVTWRLSAALIGWLAWWRLCPRAPRLDVRRAAWREVLAYGGGITATRLAKYLEVNGVDLLVGLLMHPAAVGLYRMASRLLVGVMDLLAQPLAKLNWVRVSEAARQGRDGTAESAAWHRLMLLLSWPLLAWIALSADALAQGLLGAHWLAAAPVLSALAVVSMVRAASFSLEPLFAVAGQTARLVQWRWLAALGAMACVGLAPLGGMPMVTWSQVAVAALATTMVVRAACRHAGLDGRSWSRAFLWPAGVALALLLATVLVRQGMPGAHPAVLPAVLAALALGGTAAGLWWQRHRLPGVGAPTPAAAPTVAPTLEPRP